MVRVVGVRFKMAGKVYYFDPAEFAIAAGNKVIVETVRGVEYGEIVVGPKDVEDDQVVQPLKKVIRVGTERDAQIAAENKRKEKEAFAVALKKIEAHHLDMYLVDVEYTFDGSKVIFYFTAEGRVDFRELVRDLAGVFRTRIEMRQIGVRDEAKLLGGIGPCGRILCCTSFLGDFAPVSIRMAKDQNLSLNPSKISGLCGRLMCCLRYEQDTYEAAKNDPTLAPGYVPPMAVSNPDDFALEGLEEERPTPAIGVRNRSESGFSARIAQAAVLERPEPRRERDRDRQRPSGEGRPGGRPQPQGERSGERQAQGQQQGRPKGQQGRPQERSQEQQAGQRQRPSGEARQGSRRDGRPQPQGERPVQGERQAQGERPQGERRGQPGQQRQRPQGRPGAEGGRPAEHSPARQPQGERQAEAPNQQAQGASGSSRRRWRRRGPRPEGGGSQPNQGE